MLNPAFSRYQLTTNKLVSSTIGAEGIIDGAGLFFSLENGVQVVNNGTTTATNVFAGIAFSQYRSQTRTTRVEEFVAPLGSIVLQRTPAGAISTVCVLIDGVKATVAAGDPSAEGEVQLVGDVLTFHADDEGKAVVVNYAYNLTVAEIQSLPLMGDGIPGPAVSAQIGAVSVATVGEFFTDQYDTSVDWNSTAADIKLANGGIFTRGGSTNVAVTGATVCHVPNAENPFLGIQLV